MIDVILQQGYVSKTKNSELQTFLDFIKFVTILHVLTIFIQFY